LPSASPPPPEVAVFESGLPPGLAFIRSLGRAGVPIRAYDNGGWMIGRYSRYVRNLQVSPPAARLDRFLVWLEEETERRGPALIAPTSDYIAFASAEFQRRTGIDVTGASTTHGEMIRNCLFKHRFARLMEEIGFPVPAWSLPTTMEQALEAGERLGYPVVVKPCSHIGGGVSRGRVAANAAELESRFQPVPIRGDTTAVLTYDTGLATPMLQQMITGEAVEVTSVTGFVDVAGGVHGVDCCRKTGQWGGPLAVGTAFEAIDPPPALDHVIEAVRSVLRSAIFEFEVLHDRSWNHYWALELNPRAFGQMSLSMARGHDLPLLWYESATGREAARSGTTTAHPGRWRMGLPYYAGEMVRVATGPGRAAAIRRLLSGPRRGPTVGAVHSWSDPIPGAVFSLSLLSDPKGLVRPYFKY
jgi:predicted ATP-grasp superfamily ATP-dependent carboligase